MKTRQELRAHCVQLAVQVVQSKGAKPADVLPIAQSYFDWIDETPAENEIEHHRRAIGYGR